MLAVTLGPTVHSFMHFTPQEFDRWTGTYGIDGSSVWTVQASGIGNAVVFIERSNWTDYAPFFAQNSPSLDSDLVYAIDLGPERNGELMALYPDRSFYRFSEGRWTPLGAGGLP